MGKNSPRSPQNDFNKFIEYLRGERSDRLITIVGVSFIEAYLPEFIRLALPGLTPKIDESFFGTTGIISTAAAKVHLAKAVGIINDDMHHDFLCLLKIRNIFAHELQAESVSDGKISGLLSSVKLRLQPAPVYQKGLSDFPNKLDKQWEALAPSDRLRFILIQYCMKIHNAIALIRRSSKLGEAN